MKLRSCFLIVTLVALGSHVQAQGIFAPGDAIVGGQSDGTDFFVGVAGFDGGVNNWPDGESPDHIIDGVGQKYLNFGEFNTGVIITPASGSSIARQAQFWTANDAEPRDPSGYEIWGTNEAISGDAISLSIFDAIATGDLALPSSRNAGGDAELLAENSQTVSFDNSTAYTSYMILFPDVKDADAANSMQIAEVQLSVPEPSTAVLGLLALAMLAPIVRRRR